MRSAITRAIWAGVSSPFDGKIQLRFSSNLPTTLGRTSSRLSVRSSPLTVARTHRPSAPAPGLRGVPLGRAHLAVDLLSRVAVRLGPPQLEGLLERALARFMARHLSSGTPPTPAMFNDLLQLLFTFGVVIPAELSTFFRALVTLDRHHGGARAQVVPDLHHLRHERVGLQDDDVRGPALAHEAAVADASVRPWAQGPRPDSPLPRHRLPGTPAPARPRRISRPRRLAGPARLPGRAATPANAARG